MNKLFHRLSTRILLGILLAAAISAVVYTAANGALKAFFQYYAMQPEVFQRLSDEHFADLQDFATENHIVSTDGKPFTQWNDKYHYVSLMVIRQNEGLCYNSFVSYNMTYTEEDSQTFFWGSKVLPTYEYQLQLEDETCKVYFSGYFDQAYTSLRKAICGVLFVASSFSSKSTSGTSVRWSRTSPPCATRISASRSPSDTKRSCPRWRPTSTI